MKKSNYKMQKKNDLIDRLDRILAWTNNCDTKTSIILATFGILTTLFGSEFFIEKFKAIIFYNLVSIDFAKLVFLLLLLTGFCCYLIGLLFLILELFPSLITKNNHNLNQSSTFFFGMIINKELSVFKQEILSLNIDEEIDDLISQVYINSTICARKYNFVKKGVFFSCLGFLSICVLLCFGYVISKAHQ